MEISAVVFIYFGRALGRGLLGKMSRSKVHHLTDFPVLFSGERRILYTPSGLLERVAEARYLIIIVMANPLSHSRK